MKQQLRTERGRTVRDILNALEIFGVTYLALERAQPLQILGPFALNNAQLDTELLHRVISS